MELRHLIPTVAGMMSITGYESYDAEKLSPYLSAFDEDVTDAVGNRILTRRCGREGAPRILIDTHFDEIGMYVSEILEGGFLRVASVGGLDARTMSSAAVRIFGKRCIWGIISSTPPHLRPAGKSEELTPVKDLLVDTCMSKEELEELVRIGTPVGFMSMYQFLENDRLVGKALDNKACCAVAIAALSDIPAKKLAGDVSLVLSVHEETDRIGGTAVGGYSVNPNYAMVIDVNIGLAPGTQKNEGVALGQGPSIARSAVTDRKLSRMTEAMCDAHNIPWQRYVEPVDTGTNTGALHLVRSGIPVVDIGLPLRAMHTYNEMIDLADATALENLIRAFVTDRDIAKEFS